jgi:hypothetical protein
MKTSTSLTLLAVGGILTLAVNVHPSFLNLRVTGFILIVTGLAGLLSQLRDRARLQRWRIFITGGLDSLSSGDLAAATGSRFASPSPERPAGMDPLAPDVGDLTVPDIRAI